MKIYFLFTLLASLSVFSQTVSYVNPNTNRTKRFDINKLELESKVVGKTALPLLYKYKSEKLILNGASDKQNSYTCALYLENTNKNSSNIINAKEFMIIRLVLNKDISNSKILKAFDKSFKSVNNPQISSKLNNEVELFLEYIEGTQLKEGDKVDITYEPYNEGLSLYVNYNKIATVKSFEFKKAVFNIWLSNNSIDKALTKDLISGI